MRDTVLFFVLCIVCQDGDSFYNSYCHLISIVILYQEHYKKREKTIMKITPVKGTNDYLPREAALRDYLKKTILDIYTENGFEHIYTPAIEDAENLDKSDGGENLSLIFNILKRGDKLDKVIAEGLTQSNVKDLYDLGLRYDLTLPLSRYFANNRNNLILPVKCIQIDRVYRAERPQKGRLREFIQCDIDIIGSDSHTAEVELILTTAKALTAIGLKDFRVRLNDRRLLHAVLLDTGFEKNDLESVCITFDKMDKVGIEGVCAELEEKGLSANVITAFKDLISGGELTLDYIKSKLTDKTPAEDLERVMADVTELSGGSVKTEFDLSLVRGQGYYTGTVFEVVSDKFSGSVAGGGRYDRLIGKFLNEDIPAVGFSIGFERIFAILTEGGIKLPGGKKKVAVLYNEDSFRDAVKKADELRSEGNIACLYERPKKTGKFIDNLEKYGFDGFVIVGESEEPKMFES